MKQKKLNIAIIGCGRVAGHHVKGIEKNHHLQLVAVCDINSERLAEFKADADVVRYENYHQMMQAHPELDAVAIVTPSGMHFEHAKDIITIYGKSVVIEKPVVMRLLQGEECAMFSLRVSDRASDYEPSVIPMA